MRRYEQVTRRCTVTGLRGVAFLGFGFSTTCGCSGWGCGCSGISVGGGTGGWQREGSPLAKLLAVLDPLLIWSLLTWPFAAWGLVRTLHGPRRFFQGLGFLVVLYFTALTVVFWGALRMRVPVEPMLVLFAAVGFEDARRRVRMRAHALRVIAGRR